MSYGDIIGNLIKSMTNQGQSKLEYMINSSKQAGGLINLIKKIFLSKQEINASGSESESLGTLAQALLNGNNDNAKGFIGEKALKILKALSTHAIQKAINPQSFSEEKSKSEEDKEFIDDPEKIHKLIIRAMINAAKADGQLDQQEMEKILGKVGTGGITAEEQKFIHDELNQPFDLEKLVSDVPDLTIGAQVYAASLFAIDLDTDTEKDYLRRLAHALNLDTETVDQIHAMTGAPSSI